MRIVTWNMGCNIAASGYLKHHDEAWNYLINELRPDIALVQEAVVARILAAEGFDSRICELPSNIDAGTAILVRKDLRAGEAPRMPVSSSTYAATLTLEWERSSKSAAL